VRKVGATDEPITIRSVMVQSRMEPEIVLENDDKIPDSAIQASSLTFGHLR